MKRKACLERGQTWNGDPPVCAFDGEFTDNWNCAGLDGLRNLVGDWNKHPSGVDYQYCEDQKYATVKIDHIDAANGGRIGLALWITWYKNRGRTEQVWILDDNSPPRRPAAEEVELIVSAYRLQTCAK